MKSFLKKLGDFFIPNQNDSQKKRMQKIISIIALVVLIAGIVVLCLVLNKYNSAEDNTNTYSDMLPSSEETSSDDPSDEVPTFIEPPAPRDPETGVIEYLSEMYTVNDELIGFLKIPDTELAYPVTQGEDNTYYLDHTLQKEYDPFGVPYADKDAIIVDGAEGQNITIYGHSAKDGTFFSAVKEYKNLDFYKENPIVEFDTIYAKGKYKVMGFFMEDVRMANKDRFIYHDYFVRNYPDRNTDPAGEAQDFIDQIAKRSYFDTTVDVNTDDQFITLSTCDTEVNNTDYRVVLVARKVRPGEDPAVDVEGAKENSDVVMPDGWIKKKGQDTPFDK